MNNFISDGFDWLFKMGSLIYDMGGFLGVFSSRVCRYLLVQSKD